MSTVLQFGPADHGRLVTDEEAESGSFEDGYKYEVIDGRLAVSPQADPPHAWAEDYLFDALSQYRRRRPDQLGRVQLKARVFVPGARRTTAAEPDIAAYRQNPASPPRSWRELSPFLVVEVLGKDGEEKDLERNVDLYWRVPTVEEYWVWDIRDGVDAPTLHVFRRDGDAWQTIDVGPGETYTTPLLPGFELKVPGLRPQ